MVFGLGQDINATSECAVTTEYPNIRFMDFTAHVTWTVPSPGTTCSGKGFHPFSAVCWYYTCLISAF